MTEWIAFDCIEPLDAAGVILKGLAGSGKGEATQASSGSNWMQQKANMLKWFNLFGKKKG